MIGEETVELAEEKDRENTKQLDDYVNNLPFDVKNEVKGEKA